LRYIRQFLPAEDLIYFADQIHVPYGPRSVDQIRSYSQLITTFLLQLGAKAIVLACNTASASALTYLRETFSDVPFVGMEPAVKPGAEKTNEGKIGILATEGTFGSPRYAKLMARYAQGVLIFEDPCQGLVEEIEAGNLDGTESERILRQALEPMLAAGVDTVILGCTHYPFVSSLISRLAGPDVTVIDPAPAVARQVKRILKEYDLLNPGPEIGSLKAVTTGDPVALAEIANKLIGVSMHVEQAEWQGNSLKRSS
jgi:glutamate racemase